MKYASIPFNQNKTGWPVHENERRHFPVLSGQHKAHWVVVGAGFSGVAFAQRLAERHPDSHIVLIDAESAMESASARNSGFIIGLPHNIGSSTSELKKAEHYRQLLQQGIRELQSRIQQTGIECDWHQAGKYHCQIAATDGHILQEYVESLKQMDAAYDLKDHAALSDELGTRLYHAGIYTPDSILVNPAALIAGLVRHLPANVTVYNHSPVVAIDYSGRHPRVLTMQGCVDAERVMLATNALSSALSPALNRQAPMATFASITEPLNAEQQQRISSTPGWGLTPVNAIAGATLRYTHDRRFLIRQHVEPALKGIVTARQTWNAAQRHAAFFAKAYPQLSDVKIEHTWSGTISVTRNGAPVWGQVGPAVWAVGGCNGAGISKQTIAGRLLADYVLGEDNPLIASMQALGQANWMPPSPFLDVGIAASLMKERYLGRHEI